MDHATAERLEKIMRDVGARIDESVRVVMDGCDKDEFHRYRGTAGQLMGSIFLDILKPIYAAHPDLMPAELRSDGTRNA
jgi:hypothetical protein